MQLLGIMAIVGGLLGLLYLIRYYPVGLWPLLCLSLPLSVPLGLPSGEIRFPAEALLLLIAGLSLGKIGLEKNRLAFGCHQPLCWASLSFLLVCLLATLTSSMPLVSGKRLLIMGLEWWVFFVLPQIWPVSPQQVKLCLRSFCLGMLALMLYAGWQHAPYQFAASVAPAIPKPFLPDHTLYGALLASSFFLLPMGLGGKWLRVAQILWALALILSFSRGAWLSLGLGAWVWAMLSWPKPYRWSLALLSLLLVAVAAIWLGSQGRPNHKLWEISPNQSLIPALSMDQFSSNQERVNRWEAALVMWQERPWLGYGPGTYAFQYGPFQSVASMTRISTYQGNQGNAHSEYLNMLAEVGTLGLLAWLTLMGLALHVAWRLYRQNNEALRKLGRACFCSLCVFLLHGGVNAFWEQGVMAAWIWALMAGMLMAASYSSSFRQAKQ